MFPIEPFGPQHDQNNFSCGNEALDRLLYGPGVFDDKWVRARVFFTDGGHLLLHDPRR